MKREVSVVMVSRAGFALKLNPKEEPPLDECDILCEEREWSEGGG